VPLTAHVSGFVRRLPDHGLVDRLVRGRAWIPVLGIMLAGIVAMQVSVLKLGAGIGRSLEKGATLQSQNEQLRASVAALADEQRIERLAAGMGMVMPPPQAVGFLSAQPGGAAQAVSNIKAPDATAFLSALQTTIASSGATAVVVPGTTGVTGTGTTGVSAATGATTPAASSSTASQLASSGAGTGSSGAGTGSSGATSASGGGGGASSGAGAGTTSSPSAASAVSSSPALSASSGSGGAGQPQSGSGTQAQGGGVAPPSTGG
jgi:hypothetical protein